MSDTPQGNGWWRASDGKWYPPAPPPGGWSAQPAHRDPAWLVPTHVSGWAVAAGYVGLLTLPLIGFPGPIAVLLGIKGLRHIRQRPDLNGKVRAWVGITLGGLGTAVLVVLLLL